jgi:glycosyltransferase involved in cell wall biosynthesis
VKILYVAGHLPCPPVTGALQRILHVGRHLRECGDLTFVYVGSHFPEASRQATRQEFGEVVVMQPGGRGQGLAAYLHYKLGKFRRVQPVSLADQRQFEQLLREHDLVWFCKLDIALACGHRRYPHGILDFDDLMQVQSSQAAELAPTALTRLRQRWQAWRCRRREQAALHRFARVVVCSEPDRHRLGGDPLIGIVPNGFDATASVPAPRELRLGFIGYLDYPPNRDGLLWFAREVWPQILAQQPQARLRLVGRLSPKTVLPQGDAIDALDFVEDPAAEIASWSAMIVPLRLGSGTRIKILEAFSRGCPVISTPAGAYGLAAVHEKELLLAAAANDFAAGCLRLLADAGLRERLAAAGRRLFEARYDWQIIGPEIRQLAGTVAPAAVSAISVSVILPTYNRRHLVLEAIASVLAQPVPDLEVLVIDNDSSDGTFAVVSALPDPRVRCLRETRRGVAAARNAGLRMARGRTVLFLDDDDLLAPSALPRLLAALAANPEAGVAYGGFENIWPDGRREAGFAQNRHLSGDLFGFFFRQVPHLIVTVLCRREVLAGLFFDERLPKAEDADFFLRLAPRTRFCFVPEVILWRRITAGSLSQSQQEESMPVWAGCVERFYWRLGGWRRISPFTARDRLGRLWLRLAAERLSRGERAAALKMGWHSLGYRPFATTAWRLLWQAWRQPAAGDPNPQWQLPRPTANPNASLPKPIAAD